MRRLHFVDLFSGLGGFHVAMRRLGHECVLAVEIDPALRRVYKENFGQEPKADVRSFPLKDIPRHDVLCAGFPCQPFSKAGRQEGFNCERNGDLLTVVVNWVRTAKPAFLVLENVANFLRHDDGMSWRWLSRELRHAGYSIDARVISPHNHGVPQIRERLFIVGARNGLDHFTWPGPQGRLTDLRDILDDHPDDGLPLSPKVIAPLEVWDDFLKAYPAGRQKPWFPVWAAEFGATYPFTTTAPLAVPPSALKVYRGAFGNSLDIEDVQTLASRFPPYARTDKPLPAWKVKFLQLNRDLYEENRIWIDRWLPRLKPFEHSLQKFEWNFDDGCRSIWDTVIQFRGSGIRARPPSEAPALVAATTTQTPIIGWQRRYMTIRECARLQDLGELPHLPTGQTAAMRALGNAVNARLVELIATQLLKTSILTLAQHRVAA